MTTHGTATTHEEKPHDTETTIITVSDATKRRAESVISDSLIDPQWRTVIRGALELNDPWLADLVIRAEAGENIVDTFESLQTFEANEDGSTTRKIETLAEIICRTGDEPTAALFVLMGTLADSTHPKELANTAKHFAFSRCLLTFRQMAHRGSAMRQASQSFCKYDFPVFVNLSEAVDFKIQTDVRTRNDTGPRNIDG